MEPLDSKFEFRPGPVFSGIVLADEINRASPKTQSALLEAMAEGQVTVDGVTHPLRRPFMVLATQNPLDHEGTYPLPESQLDRFLLKVTMGYANRDAELGILNTHAGHDLVAELRPVISPAEVQGMAAAAHTVHVAPAVQGYLVDLADASGATATWRWACRPEQRCRCSGSVVRWPRRRVVSS